MLTGCSCFPVGEARASTAGNCLLVLGFRVTRALLTLAKLELARSSNLALLIIIGRSRTVAPVCAYTKPDLSLEPKDQNEGQLDSCERFVVRAKPKSLA